MFRKITVPFKTFFRIYLDCLSIEFSTYHIKCEDNVMILIQTLWRCARTLITTTTLSLLFHYSLSLLCSGKTDIISYHCCMLTGNDIANDVNHACVTVRLSNQCFVIHRVLHKNEVSPDCFDI